MKKLARFTILAFLFVVLFIATYSVIPLLAAIFGGEFLAIAQHPAYVCVGGLLSTILLGAIFAECFDNNFYTRD